MPAQETSRDKRAPSSSIYGTSRKASPQFRMTALLLGAWFLRPTSQTNTRNQDNPIAGGSLGDISVAIHRGTLRGKPACKVDLSGPGSLYDPVPYTETDWVLKTLDRTH